MKSIRIGNDFTVFWKISLKDGKPYNLEEKRLMLLLSYLQGTEQVYDFAVKENTLAFTFAGKDQRCTGVYRLVLVENNDEKGMVTIDTCEAFRLVSSSCTEGGTGCSNVDISSVELSSVIDLAMVRPIIPEIKNGNWWIEGKDTGVRAEGRDGTFAYPIFSIDPNTGILKTVAPYFYEGDEFMINNEGYLTMKI